MMTVTFLPIGITIATGGMSGIQPTYYPVEVGVKD
jgi:hypothetical protein